MCWGNCADSSESSRWEEICWESHWWVRRCWESNCWGSNCWERSCSRSAHQTLKSYWSCDESFATDDQGFISEHYCAKPSPDPDRNRQWFLRNQRECWTVSPVWSSRPKWLSARLIFCTYLFPPTVGSLMMLFHLLWAMFNVLQYTHIYVKVISETLWCVKMRSSFSMAAKMQCPDESVTINYLTKSSFGIW